MKPGTFLAIIATLIIIAAGCQPRNQEGQAGDMETEQIEEREIVVRTSPLKLDTVRRSIDYTATLEAFEEVHLAPASPGRVDGIYVEAADRVSRGQKLFVMDQTQLRQAEIQLSNLKTDLSRLEKLLETGDVAKQQYDQMKTQVEVTEANVKFLRDNTVIYAPFNGVITGKYFENGEMYSGAPNTAAGKAAVVTLMQINPVKAIVNISESYLPQVDVGMDADIMVDVFPDRQYKGKVSLVHPTVNAMTRSFQVEITVANNDLKLKPGMFVRASLFLGDEAAYLVASNVVLQQEGTNNRYVFVEKNGTAVRQMVKVGKRYNEMIEITSDNIKAGDMLVVDGQTKLTDGDKIKVVN